MERDADTPYWLQSGDAGRRSKRHGRRRCSSFFLTSGFLVVILVATALFLLLIAVPAVVSFAGRILNPNSLHKGWNSLNFLLVLFAIICGFLSKNPDDNETPSARHFFAESSYSTSEPDRRTSNLIATPSPIMRRNSHSYPDLRQQSEEQWRFLDDMHIIEDRYSKSDDPMIHRPRILSIPSHLSSPSQNRSQNPSPPSDRKLEQPIRPPPSAENVRKRRGSTKEFFTSLYHRRKKRKQRNKSVDLSETFFNSELHSPISAPPLELAASIPSPQSHPSFLRNFFSSRKRARRKPLPFTVLRKSKTAATKSKQKSVLSDKQITRIRSFDRVEENVNSGGSSPGIWTPVKQPPPPPFTVPDWKFVADGDFVRVLSFHSSRSASPDPDLPDSSKMKQSINPNDSDAMPFCPSPDVDSKAKNFIEMFRARLRLEKINSMNEKQGKRLSSLCPGNQSDSDHSFLDQNTGPEVVLD